MMGREQRPGLVVAEDLIRMIHVHVRVRVGLQHPLEVAAVPCSLEAEENPRTASRSRSREDGGADRDARIRIGSMERSPF